MAGTILSTFDRTVLSIAIAEERPFLIDYKTQISEPLERLFTAVTFAEANSCHLIQACESKKVNICELGDTQCFIDRNN